MSLYPNAMKAYAMARIIQLAAIPTYLDTPVLRQAVSLRWVLKHLKRIVLFPRQ